jgi:hypothetical protein
MFYDYILRLLATEDIVYPDISPQSKLLPAQVKRSYAQTAFSDFIDLVKSHSSKSERLEACGWEMTTQEFQLYDKIYSMPSYVFEC